MSYTQLSHEERYYLETAKKAGKTLTTIAQGIEIKPKKQT